MQEIDKLRTEIDQIHTELAVLFRRRLVLVKKIWEIKNNKQMSFVDSTREESIIHRFDNATNDVDERMAMQTFFRSLLNASKMYLEEKLK